MIEKLRLVPSKRRNFLGWIASNLLIGMGIVMVHNGQMFGWFNIILFGPCFFLLAPATSWRIMVATRQRRIYSVRFLQARPVFVEPHPGDGCLAGGRLFQAPTGTSRQPARPSRGPRHFRLRRFDSGHVPDGSEVVA